MIEDNKRRVRKNSVFVWYLFCTKEKDGTCLVPVLYKRKGWYLFGACFVQKKRMVPVWYLFCTKEKDGSTHQQDRLQIMH
jgi:hypothetical protein